MVPTHLLELDDTKQFEEPVTVVDNDFGALSKLGNASRVIEVVLIRTGEIQLVKPEQLLSLEELHKAARWLHGE